jgi:fructose-bisphosphate aldolase class II
MTPFKELRFVNTKKIFRDAYRGKYAIPSLNFISMEQINAITDAAQEMNAPVIVMVAPKHCRQFEFETIVRVAQSEVDRLRNQGCTVPYALHLDHGTNFGECRLAIDSGFSSVMIDGSNLPLEENIKLTRRVVEYAHEYDVSVEGELGSLSGAEDADAESRGGMYTNPLEAKRFIAETGVDSLAVSVGTVHGLNKIPASTDGDFSGLRYDILNTIEKENPDFPLVLHGCSALPKYYIDMLNQYGGDIGYTYGISDKTISNASRTSVCKINIASDGWIPALAITRKMLAENPQAVDSCVFSRAVRPVLKEIYKQKYEIMGCVFKK